MLNNLNTFLKHLCKKKKENKMNSSERKGETYGSSGDGYVWKF